MKPKITLIPLFIFLILALALWWGLYHDPHQIPSPLIEKKIPDFNAENLIKPEVPLKANIFIGHVSLLNVFGTWCLACRDEHPLLMDIAATHVVVLYGLDYKDKRSKALAWIKKYGNPYEAIIFDPQGEAAINLGVYGTPETFIIDQKGVIRYKHIGVLSPSEWKKTLLPLIQSLEQE